MHLDGSVLIFRGERWKRRVDSGSQGIQMYWGGQAVRIILSSIIGPKFYDMANTIPASANVQTVDLVSFFIFVVMLGKCAALPRLSRRADACDSSGPLDQTGEAAAAF